MGFILRVLIYYICNEIKIMKNLVITLALTISVSSCVPSGEKFQRGDYATFNGDTTLVMGWARFEGFPFSEDTRCSIYKVTRLIDNLEMEVSHRSLHRCKRPTNILKMSSRSIKKNDDPNVYMNVRTGSLELLPTSSSIPIN